MIDLSPLTWMWILSIAGALAFFAAGVLAARRGKRVPLERALSEVSALGEDRQRLADEVTRLWHELSEVKRARPPSDPGAKDVELDLLRRRVAEAGELREENARLRAQLTQLRKAPPPPAPAPAPKHVSHPHVMPRAPVRLATQPALAQLDGIVAELRRDPNVASAVISDEMGLLVAGGGDGAETMAALGGYLAGVGVRAQDLLHLDAAARVIVEDDHGKVLTATRLPGAPLVAVTLARA
jgi:predicted regulator of Ras-like GTPase activity (Roadblock/LC7/MglB family)